jgi:hypothetical protein
MRCRGNLGNSQKVRGWSSVHWRYLQITWFNIGFCILPKYNNHACILSHLVGILHTQMAELFEWMRQSGGFSWSGQRIHMFPLSNIQHSSLCFVTDLAPGRPRDSQDNSASNPWTIADNPDRPVVVTSWMGSVVSEEIRVIHVIRFGFRRHHWFLWMSQINNFSLISKQTEEWRRLIVTVHFQKMPFNSGCFTYWWAMILRAESL